MKKMSPSTTEKMKVAYSYEFFKGSIRPKWGRVMVSPKHVNVVEIRLLFQEIYIFKSNHYQVEA